MAMNQTLMTLNQLAAEVNAWLDCAKVAEDQVRASEISAGNILAEAKEQVRAGEAGRISWAKWARENLKVPTAMRTSALHSRGHPIQ